MSVARRRELVEADHTHLSIVRQCELLSISRSGLYYAPAGESDANLMLMRLIDTQFMETPFYGTRQMVRRLGHKVGRKRVRRLMRRMGLAAVYQRPRTSAPHPAHPVYPYLLRDMAIERPNQVWCADITYIPMRRGFLYVVAVMDWASRKVLAWRVSNTMEADFCIEAVQEAIRRFGVPEIFNTDQGSQFTSPRFTAVLAAAGMLISMDGRGRWLDNVFVERLWRSLKYECVYLHAFETGCELRAGLAAWVDLYNSRRPHSALAGATPDEAFGLAQPFAGPGHARGQQRSDWRLNDQPGISLTAPLGCPDEWDQLSPPTARPMRSIQSRMLRPSSTSRLFVRTAWV
jgi:putative transposase